MAHAAVANMMGIKITEAGLSLVYAYVRLEVPLSETTPLVEFLVAIAGPIANLLVAGLFAIPVRVFGESLGENTLQYVSYINIRLFRLNLLPIAVLDGGKATHAIIWSIVGNSDFAWYGTLAVTVVFLIYLFLTRKRKRRGLEDSLETL